MARAVAGVPSPERVALRLAVQRPEEVADRVDVTLFSHPLAVSAYQALAGAETLHDAVEAADPQTADLIQRLAVEEADEDADDVMVRLVEAAAQRAHHELLAEMRAAPADLQPGYVDSLTWLRRAKDCLRTADGTPVGRSLDPALEAERRLVTWLVDRHAAGVGGHEG